MPPAENVADKFLAQLYTETNGDLTAQLSMHDVGAALGLDKEQSGKIAEDLIGEGLVEIKTLSGGVGITTEGVKAMQGSGAAPQGGATLSLGDGTVIEDDGRSAVDHLLTEIRTGIGHNQLSYARLEAIVVDIKTIEIQMLSPQPKTMVIRAVFTSLRQALAEAGLSDLATRVEHTIKA